MGSASAVMVGACGAVVFWEDHCTSPEVDEGARGVVVDVVDGTGHTVTGSGLSARLRGAQCKSTG